MAKNLEQDVSLHELLATKLYQVYLGIVMCVERRAKLRAVDMHTYIYIYSVYRSSTVPIAVSSGRRCAVFLLSRRLVSLIPLG